MIQLYFTGSIISEVKNVFENSHVVLHTNIMEIQYAIPKIIRQRQISSHSQSTVFTFVY